MGNILFRFGLVFSLLCSSISPISAGEFGNIFGNEQIESQSRAASGEALSAIGYIIKGIYNREIGETDGTQNMLAALDKLSAASDQMRKILEQKIPDFELNASEKKLIKDRMGNGYEKYEGLFSDATTFSEFFNDFVELGNRLGLVIEKHIGTSMKDQMFPLFSEIMEHYLAAGSLVTTISKGRNIQ